MDGWFQKDTYFLDTSKIRMIGKLYEQNKKRPEIRDSFDHSEGADLPPTTDPSLISSYFETFWYFDDQYDGKF